MGAKTKIEQRGPIDLNAYNERTLLRELLKREIKLVIRRMLVKMMNISCTEGEQTERRHVT